MSSETLVGYRGKLARNLAEMAVLMCAPNNKLFKQQAEQFTKASGMKWTPVLG